MIIIIYHCLFEQSGTFKNEFKKLGYAAFDYDISNDFGETDFIIDLFLEIEKAYNGETSIFDNFYKDKDYLLVFFPCTRFEHQIRMHFKGVWKNIKNKDVKQKLLYDLKLHKELSNLYDLITKLTIVCINKKIPLVIENPYTTTHYLTQYWSIPCTFVDYDRTKRGDYFEKPTQYWFINCEPKNNFIMEPLLYVPQKKINENWIAQVERSLIHPQYANRFIREFIID